MKLFHKLSPKRLFPSKKARSDPPSSGSPFSFSSSSDDPSDHRAPKIPSGGHTPRSVLPTRASGEWSDDVSGDDIQYELVQAFRLIDKDGDGRITTAELSGLLRRVGLEPPSESELRAMLSEVDRDGDGDITLEEFGAIAGAFGPARGSEELRDAFDVFDRDRDGKIAAEELLLVFRTIGDDRCTLEDCRRMIGGVDKSGDGFVCFEDFARMMEQEQRRLR